MIFPWKNHGFQSGPRRQDLGHLLPGFQGDAARIALAASFQGKFIWKNWGETDFESGQVLECRPFFLEKHQMTSKTEEKKRKDVGRKRDGESTALRCFFLSQYSLSQPKTDSTCQVKNISIGKIHQQSIGSVSN